MQRLCSISNNVVLVHTVQVLEVGVLAPDRHRTGRLLTGQVGYVITGMKVGYWIRAVRRTRLLLWQPLFCCGTVEVYAKPAWVGSLSTKSLSTCCAWVLLCLLVHCLFAQELHMARVGDTWHELDRPVTPLPGEGGRGAGETRVGRVLDLVDTS
jgi:hypothetical protein